VNIVLLRRAEDVSEEVVRRVLLCTQAQGAETNLGAALYRGRRQIDDEMIPCASVIEGDDEIVEQKGPEVTVRQKYAIYAYVPCDPADPNVAAHAALRDMKRAIWRTNGQVDYRWGRTVREVVYEGKDIAPRSDGQAFVLAILVFTVEYVETLGAP